MVAAKHAQLEQGEPHALIPEELTVRACDRRLSPPLCEASTRSLLHAQQERYLHECRNATKISDFALLKVIGAGAFGVVRLCQKRSTREVFALKQMSKADIVRKNKVHLILNEKDALSMANKDCVVDLHCTFQDDRFLYMVMEYVPGGDLMTHLQRKGTFTEAETRFYIGELVQAVDYVHTTLQCIHRDIKPDNVVLDKWGHVRLVDFGLCARELPQASPGRICSVGPTLLSCAYAADTKARLLPPRTQIRSLVGTPDYAAPEVFSHGASGRECDWWSVGIIAYEMLFGRTPFADGRHDPKVIAVRVQRWRQYLRLPARSCVGEKARSLVSGLLCDQQDRLKADELRAHPFFQGLDFERLREMEAPIKPVVRGPLDTSNFDDLSEEDLRFSSHHAQVLTDVDQLLFRGYSYRRERPSVAHPTDGSQGPREAVLAEVKVPRQHLMWVAELLVSSAILICSPLFNAGGKPVKT